MHTFNHTSRRISVNYTLRVRTMPWSGWTMFCNKPQNLRMAVLSPWWLSPLLLVSGPKGKSALAGITLNRNSSCWKCDTLLHNSLTRGASCPHATGRPDRTILRVPGSGRIRDIWQRLPQCVTRVKTICENLSVNGNYCGSAGAFKQSTFKPLHGLVDAVSSVKNLSDIHS